ncbi:MAG: hypothetical protein L0Y58_04500 [Verrucomicrobia subdivision 3 bacterium]|nr:hypothetical protein [Limisphaerales bacterium]
MAEQAEVKSIDAIAMFRSDIIAYLAKVRPLLDEACDEVTRVRNWLESDRRVFWENKLRRLHRALMDAQQALFSARMSNLRDARTAEFMAVEKAKRAHLEAEDKLRHVKRWNKEFDPRAQLLVKEIEQVRSIAINELPKAVMYLGQILKTLEAYAAVASPSERRATSSPRPEESEESAPLPPANPATDHEP